MMKFPQDFVPFSGGLFKFIYKIERIFVYDKMKNEIDLILNIYSFENWCWDWLDFIHSLTSYPVCTQPRKRGVGMEYIFR